MNSVWEPPSASSRVLDGRLCAALLSILTFAILAIKLPLIWRININWDEFFFLSNIYEYARGEITGVFQYAYVHALGWLTTVEGNEVDQVLAGRLLMLVLLCVTVWLIAKVASRWVSTSYAWLAPLCFLSLSPVLKHGASFRADSLLAPLAMLGLLALLSGRARARWNAAGGCLMGFGLAISLKTVLLAPLFLALILTDSAVAGSAASGRWRVRLTGLVLFGIATCVTAGVLLYLHSLTLPEIDSGAIGGFAVGVARKTLIDVPLFPRWDYLRATLVADWVSWLLIAGGAIAAVVMRCRAALCILSLLPLLFYRNAFPYYYLVMLAPAAILASYGVECLARFAKRTEARPAEWIPLAACIPLLLQACLNLAELRFDRQSAQRQTIEAAHQIFPQAVPYIDHSGMIASYPKTNFFMSSWGLETYRSRGAGFMRDAIDLHRPPMLLANMPTLLPGTAGFYLLLAEDRALIEKFYLPYWGPIMVAGGEVELTPALAGRLEVPFPGRYRLEANQPVLIDGSIYREGDLIDFRTDSALASLVPESTEPATVRVFVAAAQSPPAAELPPFVRLYSTL